MDAVVTAAMANIDHLACHLEIKPMGWVQCQMGQKEREIKDKTQVFGLGIRWMVELFCETGRLGGKGEGLN